MEGNLSKARTSLSYSDGSTPSPPMVRPATALRESTVPLSPNHSRNGSDNSAQGTSGHQLQPRRSASALGAAGGYREPSSSLRNGDTLPGESSSSLTRLTQHPLDTNLQTLGEDEDDELSYSDSRRNTLVSPSPTMYSDMSRSSSVVHMRDIQDQMNGLKGKISSLKQQARADSMKRRSLQSLRTPSPFTHARWDPGFMEPRGIYTPDPNQDPATQNGDGPSGDVDGKEPDEEEAMTPIAVEHNPIIGGPLDGSPGAGVEESKLSLIHI